MGEKFCQDLSRHDKVSKSFSVKRQTLGSTVHMEQKKVQGILPGYFVAHLNAVEGDRTDIQEWDFSTYIFVGFLFCLNVFMGNTPAVKKKNRKNTKSCSTFIGTTPFLWSQAFVSFGILRFRTFVVLHRHESKCTSWSFKHCNNCLVFVGSKLLSLLYKHKRAELCCCQRENRE